jgi:acetyl/propionyl-CoA carboxylase alpha subunit
MKYEVTVDGKTHSVDVEKDRDGRYQLTLDGETLEIDLYRPTPEAFQMLVAPSGEHANLGGDGVRRAGGESWEVGCVPRGDGYLVDVCGVSIQADVVDPRRKALRLSSGASGGLLVTQMPGRIIKRLVVVGDTVKKGQPLLVIEAMKMENELKSPVDGRVAEILVAEGQAVEAGTKLVKVEA